MLRRSLDLALALVTALLCIVVFEAGARLSGLAPEGSAQRSPAEPGRGWSVPDPELGWLNKEGVAVSNERGNAKMTFTAEGSRFSPLLQAKEGARLSVLLVGCSFTQGYGVADDETFLHYLNQRFPEIRFESFGTGGYNTLQSTLMAERVIARRGAPDLVIYGLLSDHLRRNVASGQYVAALRDSRGRFSQPPHARLKGDGLEMRAYRTIESWRLQSHSVILSLLQAVWIRYAHEVSGEEAEEVTRRLVERFDRSIRARGARPLVVVLKTDRPLGALVRPGSAEVLDCSHPGYGSDPALRTGGTTGHPSAKLHRHYAGCIGDWIERQLGGPPG